MKNITFSKAASAILFAVIIIIYIIFHIADSSIVNAVTYYSVYGGIDETQDLIIRNDDALLELNAKIVTDLGLRSFYNDSNIYVLDDGYLISRSEKTSTDYEFEQTIAFKEFLDERGVSLIYVNQPVKYLDDSIFSENFSIESYSNRNADILLERLRAAGVNVVDLREELKKENMDIKSMFYKTDHHWTAPAGLWAAGKMAEALNKYSGYSIDLSLYDENNFSFTTYPSFWLGEQGMKLCSAFVAKDNYTLVKPKFETSLTSINTEMEVKTFDDLILYRLLEEKNQEYVRKHQLSLHYTYFLRDLINNNEDNGKVLMIVDSYSNASEPFLALSVHEVITKIPREKPEDLRKVIEEGGYDTVLICYAQLMIGAHDDPTSINYKGFDFFG